MSQIQTMYTPAFTRARLLTYSGRRFSPLFYFPFSIFLPFRTACSYAAVLLPLALANGTLSLKRHTMPIITTDTSETSPRLQQMLGSGPGLPAALPNYPRQSVTTIDGIAAALFGLPFLAAGFFIGVGAFHVVQGRKNAPGVLIVLLGAMFFFPGLFLFVHGVRGMIRKAIYNGKAAETPGQPWLFDFHWHREGIRFSAFDAMLNRLLGALVWNAFLIPFFWIGFTQRGARPFLFVAGLFALFGIFFWVRWAQMLADLLRYGNSFLAYDEFPFFLGGTLRARLRAPRHLTVIDSLTLTLRCIQERYITSGYGSNRTSKVVCYELYKDVLTFDHERLANFVGAEIPIEFRLPADKLPTTLAATPPTYWQIEARGQARGADYEAYFLVPVYKQL